MAIPTDALWLITGCSAGLGRALACEALRRGHRVLASARNPATLEALRAETPERMRTVALDVTDPGAIAMAIAAADAWGGVDVLVNNAGYGYLAAIEEGSDAAIRSVFETNFFGAAALIRAATPGLRERRRGAIVNISSIAGFVGGAGSGYYAATKFALEGLSDALYDELRPHGIAVLSVQPGPIRTEFAGRSLAFAAPIQAYAETAARRHHWIREMDGRQSGDPEAIAALTVAAILESDPPRRLFVGNMSMELATRRANAIKETVESWRTRSSETDYPTRDG